MLKYNQWRKLYEEDAMGQVNSILGGGDSDDGGDGGDDKKDKKEDPIEKIKKEQKKKEEKEEEKRENLIDDKKEKIFSIIDKKLKSLKDDEKFKEIVEILKDGFEKDDSTYFRVAIQKIQRLQMEIKEKPQMVSNLSKIIDILNKIDTTNKNADV